MTWLENIICRVVDLPHHIGGTTALDEDGNCNVYINARLSYEAARKAYQHELEHIKKKHFWSNKPIHLIEKEAK